MLEKLLLAATITFSLNCLASIPWQTETQSSIAAASRNAASESTRESTQVAQDAAPQQPSYPNFVLSLFQQKKPGS